jgi:Domain of unknown function (DUF3384)
LWSLTSDLIEPQKPTEARHATLYFYTKLIQGQYSDLAMMRGHFFKLVYNHNLPEDFSLCLQMLKQVRIKIDFFQKIDKYRNFPFVAHGKWKRYPKF